ncbi:hypothetical protein [Kitasatospora sp. NBC_00315]|uniref:hypothetical protein n=1 Tax=Kitasatospora sp. NBC_00315 TaxID=2975963 RepID=UPI00324BB730
MSSSPPLMGAVAAMRTQAALLLLASLVSCAPAYLGKPAGADPTTAITVGVLLFVVSFGALSKARPRSWYEERLAGMAAPPLTATVIPREQTFEIISRTLTKPLLLILVVGLVLSYATGMPAGMLLAGIACSMLRQSRWPAGREKELNGRIVCPHAPARTSDDDPHLAAYRQVPYYIVHTEPAPDAGTPRP